MTTITLHYHSDSIHGLPKLSIYAVPDNFNVWDAPSTSYSRVDVASVSPGGEPAGRRNASINVNFKLKKVLMYKFNSTYKFAVSEAEFFSSISTYNMCTNHLVNMTSTKPSIKPFGKQMFI